MGARSNATDAPTARRRRTFPIVPVLAWALLVAGCSSGDGPDQRVAGPFDVARPADAAPAENPVPDSGSNAGPARDDSPEPEVEPELEVEPEVEDEPKVEPEPEVEPGPDAEPTPGSPPEPDYGEVERIARDVVDEIDARRLVVAFRIDDHPLHTRSFGDVEGPGTPLALASLSKPVTAYILQRMQDDGLLALSDPLRLHVPEITAIPNGDRIADLALFDFMTHRSGLEPIFSYAYANWEERLEDALSFEPVPGRHRYANDNYTLLTRVIVNALGDYRTALDRYVNVDGISTFRIGSYHGIASYEGAGELESSAADYLRFAERAAPLSELQDGVFGIAWFHNPAGHLDHIGAHYLVTGVEYSVVAWNGTAASGARVSFVLLASGERAPGELIFRYLETL